MPVLSKGCLRIDYTDKGQGQPVVLIHSSVSANGQWRALTNSLKDRYRVLAINLFGYGETTAWTGSSPQSLYAQAQLVLALCEEVGHPVHLVGHSFGGSVALKAAMLLGSRLAKLVLLEPNPFYLLKQAGRTRAFLEARVLRDHVKCYGSLGKWIKAICGPFCGCYEIPWRWGLCLPGLLTVLPEAPELSSASFPGAFESLRERIRRPRPSGALLGARIFSLKSPSLSFIERDL